MLDPSALDAPVSQLIRRVAADELLSRFRTADARARQKGPDEVVTAADEAAERALNVGLRALTPDVRIVGEEATHADAGLLDAITQDEWVWLVDPLDGTSHFAAGEESFGLMLALLHNGRTAAAWIYLPVADQLAHARRGSGCWLDGTHVEVCPPAPGRPFRGGVLTRFFPAVMAERARNLDHVERTDHIHRCAALRYVAMLRGEEHFAAYWRTLPWDHAPGALLVEEAGGVAARFDGSRFDPSELGATGLLVASDPATWELVRDGLLTDAAG